MKNGIAMISNFSMPVNSFSATASTGTWVSVKRKVSTVRPSEIETGMPVSISANSSVKMIVPRAPGLSATSSYFPAKQRPTSRSGTPISSSDAPRPLCGLRIAVSAAGCETVMAAAPPA
jgi:hypothetical protein